MTRLMLLTFAIAIAFALPLLVFGDRFDVYYGGPNAVSKLRTWGSWAWVIGAALIVADLALPIPATAVMAALGVIYGPIVGGLVSAAASAVAGLLAYGIARWIGPRAASWLVGDRDMRRARRFFLLGGGAAVAATRPLPLLPETVATMAGLAEMPFRQFCVALICGSLPTGFMYAGVGAIARIWPSMSLLAMIVLTVLLWALAHKLTALGGRNRRRLAKP